MAKPLSRPNEIGRAIGYKVDVSLLLTWLKQASDPATASPDGNAWLKELERAADSHAANAPRKSSRRLWVVVKSERGVPVLLDAYRDKRSANSRAQFLRLDMNPDEDRVELFAVPLEPD